MRSDPRTIVVTGASAGVGRAVARRFARDPGARVALLARGRDGLDGARREVEAAGARALALEVDVADAEAVDAAAATVEQQLGEIDVWVNDAMTTVFSWFADVEPDEYRRATEVTYLGTVWGTRAALRRMLPRDRGTVVQVGSALAYRGIPLQAPYCGAKHAVKGFTESLRCELRALGSAVHVTMVQLPGVNTPQFEHCRDKLPQTPRPVPPVYEPEVAADAVHWAAAHRRRELWVGLPTVRTIVGNRLSPMLVERYLARNGIDSQQTGAPVSPERADNLFHSPPGDRGAHGPFDRGARARSVQVAASKHRRLLAAAAASAAASGAVAAWRAARAD